MDPNNIDEFLDGFDLNEVTDEMVEAGLGVFDEAARGKCKEKKERVFIEKRKKLELRY